MKLNVTFNRLINNKKLEKKEKKTITEQLVLLSKSGQNSGQASGDSGEKEEKFQAQTKTKARRCLLGL